MSDQHTTELPSGELLRECLAYEAETGYLFWKERDFHTFEVIGKNVQRPLETIAKNWNLRFAGKRAFASLSKGPVYIGRIRDTQYLTHRIIYKMFHDHEFTDVRHKNLNTLDNRISNLYRAEDSEMVNRVIFLSSLRKYNVRGPDVNETFDTKNEAVECLNEVERNNPSSIQVDLSKFNNII